MPFKDKQKKREADRKYDKKRKFLIRGRILEILGNKCVYCGFSDLRALQIDHINGGGEKERKIHKGNSYYRYILKQLKTGSKDYQLLCANCNMIKGRGMFIRDGDISISIGRVKYGKNL
jgi:hypothetical protein